MENRLNPEESQADISVLLESAAGGNKQAQSQLFERVEQELQIIARGMLRNEREGHSWQTIDLVNEVAVKLIQSRSLERARNRSYFFAAVGRAMRQLLIDRARRRAAQKRPQNSIALDDVIQSLEQEQKVEILALNEAMEKLKSIDERKHDVVQLRFFGGLKFKEIAEHLDVSVPTIERDWQFAQAWLRSNMAPSNDSD